MSRLAAFQQGFIHAVVRGLGVGELGSKRGFDVYRRNVVFAAADVFELVFPSVRSALGLQNLRFFVRELLTTHPPRSPSWLEAAQPFPAFLNGRAELGSLPFIGDLAQLDWLVARALRQAHAVPERVPSLGELTQAAAAGALIPLNVLQTPFPVAALRKLEQAEWQQLDPTAVERVPTHWLCVTSRPDGVAIDIVTPA